MTQAFRLAWPAKPLWPNFRSRSHWPKTRALKVARELAFYTTKEHKITVEGDGPIELHVTFHPPCASVDRDNMIAAFKAYQDGIADALKINDNRFRPVYHFGAVTKPACLAVCFAATVQTGIAVA